VSKRSDNLAFALGVPVEPASVPRLALSIAEACAVLGVGHDFWTEHISPEIRIVRVGRRKLVPVGELVAWIDRHAESTSDTVARRRAA
jgi:hypothetical protein